MEWSKVKNIIILLLLLVNGFLLVLVGMRREETENYQASALAQAVEVLERSGMDRALYLGDTQGDLDAADRAGIPFVHAAYGFGKVDRPVPAIHDLAELPALGYVVVPQAQGPMVEAACPGHAFELRTF